MTELENICSECGKQSTLKCKPSRGLTSPNKIESDVYYCSKDCMKIGEKKRYAFFAELDRNASDSKCFEHDHWEKDYIGRNIRVGKCKINGKEVRVEPMQPGDNSGQPIECYEHFEMRI